MKDVEALSDGRVRLSTGTLYGALKRFLERGWIERREESVHNSEGRERKAYALTHLGKRVLEAEVERLDELVTAARGRAVGEEA
jgi:DNA-binding PadR family transcriptional regulator